MPLYEFKCKQCGDVWTEILRMEDRNSARCSKCGGEGKRLYTSISVHLWTPQWFEHIDREPIFIESKKQLKRECEKRGLIALALE